MATKLRFLLGKFPGSLATVTALVLTVAALASPASPAKGEPSATASASGGATLVLSDGPDGLRLLSAPAALALPVGQVV
ncbi:MAG: hypothetical protein V1750_02995, partial [Acidobacteriota bacterium]